MLSSLTPLNSSEFVNKDTFTYENPTKFKNSSNNTLITRFFSSTIKMTTASDTTPSSITSLNSNRPRMMVPTFKNILEDTNELLIELELSTI